MAQTPIFEIIESPLTSGKVLTAMNGLIATIAASGVPLMCSFNQGRSIMIGFVERDTL